MKYKNWLARGKGVGIGTVLAVLILMPLGNLFAAGKNFDLSYSQTKTSAKPGDVVQIQVSLENYQQNTGKKIVGFQINVQLDTDLFETVPYPDQSDGKVLANLMEGDMMDITSFGDVLTGSYMAADGGYLPTDTTKLFEFSLLIKDTVTTDVGSKNLNVDMMLFFENGDSDVYVPSDPLKIGVYGQKPKILLGGAPSTGQVYTNPVAVSFDKGSGTLSKDAGEFVPIESGHIVSKNGLYQVVVTDQAGNTQTQFFKVEVGVSNIGVHTPPHQTTYIQNQELNLFGGQILVTYANWETAVLPMSMDMVSGYQKNTLGTQSISVSYQGKTTSFDVVVRQKQLQELKITTNPTCTTYIEGEAFDKSGMVVQAIYDNGESCIVTDYTTDKTVFALGDEAIYIIYENKSVSLPITVVQKSLQSIAICALPQTIFKVDTAFSTQGGKLDLIYDNGQVSQLDLLTSMCTPVAMNTLGQHTVSVTYMGKTTSYDITVIDKQLTNIQIATQPTKQTFVEGTAFEVDGMLRLFYDNDTSSLQPITQVMCSTPDMNSLGTQVVLITFGGKTTQFTIEVRPKSPVGIELLSPPHKVSFVQGESLDVSGGKLLVRYDNGTTKQVDLSLQMVSGYQPNALGTQQLQIDYLGKTAVLQVQVTALTFPKFETQQDDGGVLISAPEGVLPQGAKITSTQTNAAQDHVISVQTAYGPNARVVLNFDFALTDASGQPIVPRGAVTVAMKLPQEYTGAFDLRVVYLAPDGTITQLPCQIENGYVMFSTDHFSQYAIVLATSPSPATKDVSRLPFSYIWCAAFGFCVIALGKIRAGR